MAEQEEVVPREWLSHYGEYNIIDAYKKPFIVVQHDPLVKVELTELFRDNGHTILQTDLNYTGMIWKDKTVMGLLNFADNPNIHCIFMPFKMRKWAEVITPSYIFSKSLYYDTLFDSKLFDGIVTSFKNRELFGHLNMHCLRIGVRVHCFWGDATTYTNKIKHDICWALQYEAQRNHLCWNFSNAYDEATTDITLIVTVSVKCYMTGIQVRRPRPQIPQTLSIDGIDLMWPFLQASETMRVLNYHRGDQFQSVCMMTYGDAVAAFVKMKKKSTPNDTNPEQVSWLPLQWEMGNVMELKERIIPSKTDRDLTAELMVIRQWLRQVHCLRCGIDEDYYIPIWVA